MILFEYLDGRGRGAVTEWRRKKLTVQQRAQLDDKTDQLRDNDPDLLPGLMAGTGRRTIYKLQIGGKVRLRPLLCRGPIYPDQELTLLAGAFERDGDWEPRNALDVAETRKDEICRDPRNRRGRYD